MDCATFNRLADREMNQFAGRPKDGRTDGMKIWLLCY